MSLISGVHALHLLVPKPRKAISQNDQSDGNYSGGRHSSISHLFQSFCQFKKVKFKQMIRRMDE